MDDINTLRRILREDDPPCPSARLSTLNAEVKIGPTRLGLDGGISVEPDYFGRGVGLAVSADVYNKQITPTLA